MMIIRTETTIDQLTIIVSHGQKKSFSNVEQVWDDLNLFVR